MFSDTNTSSGQFSIVIIPDTQILSRSHPSIFSRMSQWIVNNAESLRIQMVLHVGDVVHNGSEEENQFKNAQAALASIFNANIPLLIAAGNHDYDNLLATDRTLSMFNTYFGVHKYKDKSWFGATYEPEKIENCYATLDIEGKKLLFLVLEFGPRDEVLAWADDILAQYADHDAIIITHTYMYVGGERTSNGDNHNPKSYIGAVGANDGEDMWQKSLKRHSNLIAVFSGHHIHENVSYSIDLGDHKNPVFQSFQNWQSADNGGSGRIRIMKFNLTNHTIKLQVFNPTSEALEIEDGYEVHIPYKGIEPIKNIKFPL